MVSKCFWQVLKGLKSCISKKLNFSWTSPYFRVPYPLKHMPAGLIYRSGMGQGRGGSWGQVGGIIFFFFSRRMPFTVCPKRLGTNGCARDLIFIAKSLWRWGVVDFKKIFFSILILFLRVDFLYPTYIFELDNRFFNPFHRKNIGKGIEMQTKFVAVI